MMVSGNKNLNLIKNKGVKPNGNKDVVKLPEFAITFALFFLIAPYIWVDSIFYKEYSQLIAIGLLAISLLTPFVLKPFAVIWLKIGAILGLLSNTVLLGIVFFIILTPLAMIKRLFSKKKLSEDTYWIRETRTITKEDLQEQF